MGIFLYSRTSLSKMTDEEPKVEVVTTENAKVEEKPEPTVVKEEAKPVADAETEAHKLNRGEKKCRKALSKLGMKNCEGFTRISLRKRDGVIFVMNDPDVFKSSESSYCCFGELKIEDPNQRMQQMEAKKFGEGQAPTQFLPEAEATKVVEESKNVAAAATGANEAPENEEGLTPSHIDMVMNHAGCSRNEAVRALRAANDDMIAAVMQLTQ